MNTPNKRLVKISNSPDTWIEVDSDLSDSEIEEKVKRYKQLTKIK